MRLPARLFCLVFEQNKSENTFGKRTQNLSPQAQGSTKLTGTI
jgi:hypothetical protein